MAIKAMSNQLPTTHVHDAVLLIKKVQSRAKSSENRSFKQFFLELNPKNWFREFSDIKIALEEFEHAKPISKNKNNCS
jgi:hypothetical protein